MLPFHAIENCYFFKPYELFVNAFVYIIFCQQRLYYSAVTPFRLQVHNTARDSDTSPASSASPDNASSASDYDREPDQVSTLSEQPPRKKRQRTTFSPLEVWELERAYRRQPYLLSKDEEDLAQRLGITAKSLRVKVY